MLEFHRRKDTNLFHTTTQRDISFIGSEQSKTLYDYALKHENYINEIKSEVLNLKTQIMELAMKSSFSPKLQYSNSFTSNSENNNLFLSQIKKFKNEIKTELMSNINDIVSTSLKQFREEFDNLKEEMIINDEQISKKKIKEINNSLENINQKLIINTEEKNNLENNILTRVNNDKIEISNTAENIIKRIDNFDMDFDRLIVSLKNQFLNSANTINQLQLSKVNIDDYEKQIDIINQTMDELNSRILNIESNSNSNINNAERKDNQKNKNDIKLNNNSKTEEFKKNLFSNDKIAIKKELYIFKNDLYNDLEKINNKILNELKNQADDISLLYQEIKNINPQSQINQKLISFDNHTLNIPNNNLSYLDLELSKKANLDQLNFALETQAKLNDAFSSVSRMSRFCWDSEGTLKEDKFIKWSLQNINTALDVFKWEKNSENIKILQNGVYKVVLGLIGLESKKNFGIIFNDEENIVIDSNLNSNTLYENENDLNSDKGNIQFMIKYIACIENTNIKAIIFNNKDNENDNNSNDNSEEAFLEIVKII